MHQKPDAFTLVFGTLSAESLFSDWFSQAKLEPDFLERIYALPAATNKCPLSLVTKQMFEESHLVARTWFDVRLADFKQQFNLVANIQGNEISTYRQIVVDDSSEFIAQTTAGRLLDGYEGLGVYWTWSTGKAQAYWGGSGQALTMHARVHLKDIDVRETLLLNLHLALGEDEAELRLKEGADVYLTKIELPASSFFIHLPRTCFAA
jgi:hypothetical protein